MAVAVAWLRAEVDGETIRSLASLVPNYLAHVPRDPADGQPLRCLPDKRVIYSIGTDLHDDHGRAEPPEPKQDEEIDLEATTARVFQIPIPQ